VRNLKTNVLDKGYVRLVDVMGSDLTPVNAARVSYDKESHELTEKDIRLIKFLAREGHSSPFRHAMLQFEIYAPLMVARQWWKYCIGSSHQDNMLAWNESSRRYITEEPVFYIPDEWRSAPANSKQGSGSIIEGELHDDFNQSLNSFIKTGLLFYNYAIENGLCAEQARLFLPAYGMYVRWYWTSSLQGVAHFINQRLAHDAQKEIQQYAKAVYFMTEERFPFSVAELVDNE
jgi:thymidylate synthase (FAD)